MTILAGERSATQTSILHRDGALFSYKQECAREYAKARGVDDKRPPLRIPKSGNLLVPPAPTRNEKAFRQLVKGITTKMLRGAVGNYVNGLDPSYWRGLGTVAATGYNAPELRDAIAVEANRRLQGAGYCVRVSLELHPVHERLVLKLKIVRKTPR